MSEKHERLKELKIDRADIEKTRSGGGLGLLLIAAVLVLVGGGAWWWYREASVPVVAVAPVEEVDVAANPAATVLDASGYVTARLQATVSSKVTGKIVEVLIEEGMEVEAGQVLARLDTSIAERQLALAEADLARAKSSLEETRVRIAEARLSLGRAERLVAADVATQADLDAARAEVDSLVARLALGREECEVAGRVVELRRQELEDTVIRAPFAGVVVTKNAQPGEMISPVSAGGGFTRTGIGTLVDMGSLEIEVDVNEAYINRVEPGQEVEATLDAYPGWTIPARVITPVPTADRQKATVRVRIALETRDPRILPDMGVKVSFLEERPEVVPGDAPPRWRIPETALRRDGETDVVFVVTGETVERRAVKVASRQDGRAGIAAGLKKGERVVVESPAGLADGARVKVGESES